MPPTEFQPLLPPQFELTARWFHWPNLCRSFRLGMLSQVPIARRATETDYEDAWTELHDTISELWQLLLMIERDTRALPAAQRLCPKLRAHLRSLLDSDDPLERAAASNAAATTAVEIIWALGAKSQIPIVWSQFNQGFKAYDTARWAVHDLNATQRIPTELFHVLSVAGYANRKTIVQLDRGNIGGCLWLAESHANCSLMECIILIGGMEFKHMEALSLEFFAPLHCIGVADDYGVYHMRFRKWRIPTPKFSR